MLPLKIILIKKNAEIEDSKEDDHQNDDITEEEYFDEDDSDDNESDKDVIESNANESITSQKKFDIIGIMKQNKKNMNFPLKFKFLEEQVLNQRTH